MENILNRSHPTHHYLFQNAFLQLFKSEGGIASRLRKIDIRFTCPLAKCPHYLLSITWDNSLKDSQDILLTNIAASATCLADILLPPSVFVMHALGNSALITEDNPLSLIAPDLVDTWSLVSICIVQNPPKETYCDSAEEWTSLKNMSHMCRLLSSREWG